VCLECSPLTGYCFSHAISHLTLTKHDLHALVRPAEPPTLVSLAPSGSFSFVREFHPAVAELCLTRRYDPSVFHAPAGRPRRALVAGFPNLGCTCYLNANLHLFLAIPEFAAYCLTDSCASASALGFELHRFVGELVRGRHAPVSPRLLRIALNAGAPQYLLPAPIDSTEYFEHFFKTVRERVPAAPLDLAEFTLLSVIECEKSVTRR
jgi:hypothetical protein